MQVIPPFSNHAPPDLHTRWDAIATVFTRSSTGLRSLTQGIPPGGLVLLSILSVQIGSALAKNLFVLVNPLTATALRVGIAAMVMWLVACPRLQNYPLKDYGIVIRLGLWMALGNLAFYEAIARIPLGVATALEFVGPLGVAVLGSRRVLDLFWVALAAMGVVLLTPLHGDTLDLVGVGMAFAAALCWGCYIQLAGQAGQAFSGSTGLTLALTVATILLAPIGVLQGGDNLLMPLVILLALGLGVVGTVIPYSLEFAALKRLPPRVFGILMSIEPAIAALVGLVFLQERLNSLTLLGISLVTGAAMGVTLFGQSNSHSS